MSAIYKLEFEVVSPVGPGAKFYQGEEPNCRPEAVPEEFWSKVTRQGANLRDQYDNLKAWAASGEQLIRNVQLFQAVMTDWTLVDAPAQPCHPLDKDYMKEAARALESKLPDNHGFILFVTSFNSTPNERLYYVSTICREDAIATVKEWLIKAGAEEDWMKHIK